MENVMIGLLERIPWPLRALMMWCGTLAGIGLCFYCSRADWAVSHSWQESLGIMTGWFMAFGSPIILLNTKSPWDD
jgi:alcohol dehydrogenase YqhD (iron-dependent ADH family)